MKFRKPPVVEVWVSFDFESNENKISWPSDMVEKYMAIYATDFPNRNVRITKAINLEDSPGTIPKIVNYQEQIRGYRLRDVAESQMLHVGDDELSYHIMKTSSEIPVYRKVCTQAQEKLEKYVELLAPKQIRHATLHYLDIVDIPLPASRKIDLKEYFPLWSDLPVEPFGDTCGITQQFKAACPVDPGPLFLQFKMVPTPEHSDVLRFQMEWHKQSTDVNSLNLTNVWKRMDTSHAYMWDCFKASFSQRTLDLFEPTGQD